MIRVIRSPRAQSGFTLPEMLVGMMLIAILTTAVFGTVTAVYRASRVSDQDSDALASLRLANDRLTRELRQARKLDPSSTARRMQFWVDVDRDNQAEPAEWVVWEVTDTDTGAELTRATVAEPTPVIISRHLVPADAFTYNSSSPDSATLVTVVLSADVAPNELSPARTLQTEVRLRNATSS